MRNNALENLIKQVKRKRILKRAIALLSVVVILVTFNFTKFRADTLQHYADCGFNYDHQHGPECYDAEGNLTCALHVHTDACYQTRPDSGDPEEAESYIDAEAVIEEAVSEPVEEKIVSDLPVEETVSEPVVEAVSEQLEEAVEEVEVQLGGEEEEVFEFEPETVELESREFVPEELPLYYVGEQYPFFLSDVLNECDLDIPLSDVVEVGQVLSGDSVPQTLSFERIEYDYAIYPTQDCEDQELAIIMTTGLMTVRLIEAVVPEWAKEPVQLPEETEEAAVEEATEQVEETSAPEGSIEDGQVEETDKETTETDEEKAEEVESSEEAAEAEPVEAVEAEVAEEVSEAVAEEFEETEAVEEAAEAEPVETMEAEVVEEVSEAVAEEFEKAEAVEEISENTEEAEPVEEAAESEPAETVEVEAVEEGSDAVTEETEASEEIEETYENTDEDKAEEVESGEEVAESEPVETVEQEAVEETSEAVTEEAEAVEEISEDTEETKEKDEAAEAAEETEVNEEGEETKADKETEEKTDETEEVEQNEDGEETVEPEDEAQEAIEDNGASETPAAATVEVEAHPLIIDLAQVERYPLSLNAMLAHFQPTQENVSETEPEEAPAEAAPVEDAVSEVSDELSEDAVIEDIEVESEAVEAYVDEVEFELGEEPESDVALEIEYDEIDPDSIELVEKAAALHIEYDETLLNIEVAEDDYLITPIASFDSTTIVVEETWTILLLNSRVEVVASMPAQSFEGTTENVIVKVDADEGAFPEGTTMTLQEIDDEDTLTGIGDAVGEDFVEVQRVHAVDITFLDAEGNKIEPLIPISVIMSIRETEQDEDTVVVHMDDAGNAEVVQDVVNIAAETAEVTAEEAMTAEEAAAIDVEVQLIEAPTESVSFVSDAFSVYAVVVTKKLEAKIITAGEETYKITVTYTEDADIPGDATLDVQEITGDEAQAYLEQAQGAVDQQIALARFFDIKIMDGDTEVQPAAPVMVTAELVNDEAADLTDATPCAVHFAGEEPDVVEASETDEAVTFTAEGFSVWGVVYTVDFHWNVDGGTYEYELTGGGAMSLRALVEALHVLDGVAEDAEEAEQAEPVEVVEPNYDAFMANIASVTFSDEALMKPVPVAEDTTAGALKAQYALEPEYSAELTEAQIAELDAQAFTAPDWALFSLKPFATEETLTVIMKDGEAFVIRVTDAQIKKTVIDAKGDTWEITVTYGEDAQIPDGAELKVEEILPEVEDYNAYYQQASEVAVGDAERQGIEYPVVANARLFDIEIRSGEEKVEPAAPVQVDIRLVGDAADLLSVVHFAEEGPEAMAAMEGEVPGDDALLAAAEVLQLEETGVEPAETVVSAVTFRAEAFSVYTVVSVNNDNLAQMLTDGSYALVTGIAGDPGSTTGYSESWGQDYFTIIVNAQAMDDESGDDRIGAINVHAWSEDDQNYVGGSDAETWYFEPDGTGKYYMYVLRDGTRYYINQYNNSQEGCDLSSQYRSSFTITPNNDGTVLIHNGNWYLHNYMPGSNEWGPRGYRFSEGGDTSKAEYRFRLCKASDAFDSFAAQKIPVSQVVPGGDSDNEYVIYRKFEDEQGNEALYALASDGTFVRVYDGGDRIYWRETDKNIYWHYQTDGNFLTSTLDGETVHISPMDSTAQTIAEGAPESSEYLTLSGKTDGTYGTSIERWDQAAYDYAGLHVVRIGDSVTLTTGTRNEETCDEFLFALASGVDVPSNTTPEPVATVDSDSLGIKITVFDYGDPDGNYAAGDKLEGMTAVAGSDEYTPHAAHALVKPYLKSNLPSGSNGAMTGLFTTDGSEVTYFKENVNHLFLQSYYDENGTFRYRSEDNYAYLGTGTDFTVYRQVATPYVDDNSPGHTYYNHGHYMPFNDIDMSKRVSRLMNQYGNTYEDGQAIGELPIGDGRTYEYVYGIQGKPNYYTGLKMEAAFVQPSGGTLENGDDMVFKFSGDDDMWVYIDGILVLDIGGIHEPLSGTIDFATGKVVNPVGSSLAGEQTLKQIFMEVYNDPNTPDEVKDKIAEIEWDGDTFADHTTHSFSAFYMERGAGASNLDLQFNLKITKKDEFSVRKELPKNVDTRFVNQEYKYQATYKNGEDISPLHAGIAGVCTAVVYKDKTDAHGDPVPVDVDDNGYFTLKPGEEAVFKMASETIQYDVKEINVNTDLIKQVDINNTTNVQLTDETGNGKVADAGFAEVEDRSQVVFTNHPLTRNLQITKHLSEDSAPLEEGENPVFEFRVYLESIVTEGTPPEEVHKLIPYAYGPYYLVTFPEEGADDPSTWVYYTLNGVNNAPVRQGTTPVICSTTGRSGTINSIPVGYTIVIPDLAVGTNFYVEERRATMPDGYEFASETLSDNAQRTLGDEGANSVLTILTHDEYSNGETFYYDIDTVGSIAAEKDAKDDVYNRKPAIEIPVKKQWDPDVSAASPTPAPVSMALVRFKLPAPGTIHEYEQGKGAIIIHHWADYGNGEEVLPRGFHATYNIVNKDTNEAVYEGVEAGIYDVDPGEYTVTANVTNPGVVSSNYAYNQANSTESVDVTVYENQSSTAVLTRRYNEIKDGSITISHVASYTDGTEEGKTTLPEDFETTYTIKNNATGKTVLSGVPAGTHAVPPGSYTVSAHISTNNPPENYYHTGTPALTSVEVTSENDTPVTLTSNYIYRPAPPKNGTLTFTSQAVFGTGSSPTALPNEFRAHYQIIGPDGNVVVDQAQVGSEYELTPGEYYVTVAELYNQGQVTGNYFWTDSTCDPVNVESEQTVTANVLNVYEPGGTITLHAYATYDGGATTEEMPSGAQVGFSVTDSVTGYAVALVGQGENVQQDIAYSIAPGTYKVHAEVYYAATPNHYTYLAKEPSEEIEVVIVSGHNTQANTLSVYKRDAVQNITYTLTGTWKDAYGNDLSVDQLPSSGSIVVKLRGKNSGEVDSFILNSTNHWIGTLNLEAGEGNNNSYYIQGSYDAGGDNNTDNITIDGVSMKSITFDPSSGSDTEDSTLGYTAVTNDTPFATTVELHGYNGQLSSFQYDSNTIDGWRLGNIVDGTQIAVPLKQNNQNVSKYTLNFNYVQQKTYYTITVNGSTVKSDYLYGQENKNSIEFNAAGGPYVITLLSDALASVHTPFDLAFNPFAAYAAEDEDPVQDHVLIPEGVEDSIPESFFTSVHNVDPHYELDTGFCKTFFLSGDTDWERTISGLSELDAYGQPYYYALVEVGVPTGYEVSYGENNPVSGAVIKANMDDRAEALAWNAEHSEEEKKLVPDLIALTAINTQQAGSIEVTKQWTKNGADKTFDGETFISFTLYQAYTKDSKQKSAVYTAYGTNGTGTVKWVPANDTEQPPVAAHWETVIIPNLPLRMQDPDDLQWYTATYYVEETPDVGPNVAITYKSATDTASATPSDHDVAPGERLTIINTESEVEIDILKIDSEDMDKTSEEQRKLGNAVFRIFKFNDTTNQFAPWSFVDHDFATQEQVEECDVTTSSTEDGTKGTASFTGLVAGRYKLHEVQAPDGYGIVSNNDIYFTIDVNGSVKWTDANGIEIDNSTSVENGKPNSVKYASATSEDNALFTIGNMRGARLPATGGPGTTGLYVLGSILTLLATVLLITRKKTDSLD